MRASLALSRAPLAAQRAERTTTINAVRPSGLKSPTQSRLAPVIGTATGAPMALGLGLRRGSSSTCSSASVAAAAASSSSSPPPPASSSSSSSTRHAPLHDFCALIPYGFLVGVAALVSLAFFGARDAAGVAAAASASSLLSARLSLARWRSGASCAPVTAAAAAVATSAAFWFYRASASLLAAVSAAAAAKTAAASSASAAVSVWSLRSGAVLSAAVAAILWGNLLLGGNAPRRKTVSE